MSNRVGLLIALSIVAAACTGSEEPSASITDTPEPAAATTEPAPPSPATTAPSTTTALPSPPTALLPPIGPDPEFVLRYAVPGPIDMRSNPFALGDAGAFPEVFAAHLYRVLPPTFTLIPELAADDEPPSGFHDGGWWVIPVDLNEGLTWSDGDPIDAFDVQYTFEDLVQFGDPADHGWVIDDPRGVADLVSVTAVDDYRVEFRFTSQPTIDRWHFGIATAAILPEHFWAFTFATLGEGNQQDPGLGMDAPSAGGYRFGTASDSEWTWEAVDRWWNSGAEYTVYENGAVAYRNPRAGIDETYGADPAGAVRASWVEGPYAGEVEWQGYGDQPGAIFAVATSEQADLVVGRIFRSEDNLPDTADMRVSPSAGITSIAYNPRHPALVTAELRAGIACFLLLDFLTSSGLQGVVERTGWAPEDHTAWFAETFDDPCPVDEDRKIAEGIDRMAAAGWMWDTPPLPEFAGDATFPAGTGLRHGDGIPLQITIVAPKTSRNPVSASTGRWVEAWLDLIGFDTELRQGTPAEFPDWDILIIDDTTRLPPRPFLANEAGFTLTHLNAAGLSAATAEWSKIRTDLARMTLALPLHRGTHIDLIRRELTLPYTNSVGGLDAALIATTIQSAS